MLRQELLKRLWDYAHSDRIKDEELKQALLDAYYTILEDGAREEKRSVDREALKDTLKFYAKLWIVSAGGIIILATVIKLLSSDEESEESEE